MSCLTFQRGGGDLLLSAITALDQNICILCEPVESLASDRITAQDNSFLLRLEAISPNLVITNPNFNFLGRFFKRLLACVY
jgi:hypothetical protein